MFAATGGDDGDLRWRDDRGELRHWEATEIAEGERCVGELCRLQLVRLGARHKVAKFGRDGGEILTRAVEQRWCDQAIRDGDGDTDIDLVDALERLAAPDGVECWCCSERLRKCSDEPGGDGDAVVAALPFIQFVVCGGHRLHLNVGGDIEVRRL